MIKSVIAKSIVLFCIDIALFVGILVINYIYRPEHMAALACIVFIGRFHLSRRYKGRFITGVVELTADIVLFVGLTASALFSDPTFGADFACIIFLFRSMLPRFYKMMMAIKWFVYKSYEESKDDD